MSPEGRNWQARRISGAAPIRSSVARWSVPAAGQESSPAVTRTRQVEQRALPPHMEAWGRWKLRLASNTDQPPGARTVRPGYEIEIRRLRLCSSTLRTERAPKAAPIREI